MANKIMRIEGPDGMEKPAIMVTIFAHNIVQFRAHTWGVIEGHTFFDTVEGVHIELFNGAPYMIQTPAKGYTIDESGRHRELRKEESVILQ